MKITMLNKRGAAYASPDVRVLNLELENGFASSVPEGKWKDAGYSSTDFTIGSDYYGEFE